MKSQRLYKNNNKNKNKNKSKHQIKNKRIKKQRKKTKKYKAYLFSQMKGGQWTPHHAKKCKESIAEILKNGTDLSDILNQENAGVIDDNVSITAETNYQNTEKITKLMNNVRKCFPNANRSHFHIMALVNADEEKKYLTDLLEEK
jgi:hypothetical protein